MAAAKTEDNERVRFLSDEEEVALARAIRNRFRSSCLIPSGPANRDAGVGAAVQLEVGSGRFPDAPHLALENEEPGPRSIPLNDTALRRLEQLRGVRSGVSFR